MFCSSCGKQIADNSRFCMHCGVSIEHTVKAPNVQNTRIPVQISDVGFYFDDPMTQKFFLHKLENYPGRKIVAGLKLLDGNGKSTAFSGKVKLQIATPFYQNRWTSLSTITYETMVTPNDFSIASDDDYWYFYYHSEPIYLDTRYGAPALAPEIKAWFTAESSTKKLYFTAKRYAPFS